MQSRCLWEWAKRTQWSYQLHISTKTCWHTSYFITYTTGWEQSPSLHQNSHSRPSKCFAHFTTDCDLLGFRVCDNAVQMNWIETGLSEQPKHPQLPLLREHNAQHTLLRQKLILLHFQSNLHCLLPVYVSPTTHPISLKMQTCLFSAQFNATEANLGLRRPVLT